MPLLCLGLLAALGATGTAAQDPVDVAPKNYHLEVENRWVRVLRLKLGARESVPLHEQPESVVVFLTGAHERITSPGKPEQEITRKAGQVAHFDGFRNAEENLADQPLEAVII